MRALTTATGAEQRHVVIPVACLDGGPHHWAVCNVCCMLVMDPQNPMHISCSVCSIVCPHPGPFCKHDVEMETADMPALIDVVALLLMRWDGKIAVEKRKPDKVYAGLLGLVGGRVEPPETIDEAAVRETREETGLTLKPHSLTPICTTVDKPYRILSYTAEWEGLNQFNIDSPWIGLEGQDMYWKTLDELCDDPCNLTPATWQAVSTVLPYADTLHAANLNSSPYAASASSAHPPPPLPPGQVEWLINGKPADRDPVELRPAPSKNDPLGAAFPSASSLDAHPLARSDTSSPAALVSDTPPPPVSTTGRPDIQPQGVEQRLLNIQAREESLTTCSTEDKELLWAIERSKRSYDEEYGMEEAAMAATIRQSLHSRKSACIMYLGYSQTRLEVCTIMLRLRRLSPGGNAQWCTPGGYIEQDETPEHAAFRELFEELFSLPAEIAAERADEMTSHSLGDDISGPYGATFKNHAFLLTHVLGDVDNIISSFTPNDEIDAAMLVPLHAIDGSATTVSVDGQAYQLRDKFGYLRVKAARALPLKVDEWKPQATSHAIRAASATKTKASSLTSDTPPTRYSDAACLAPSAGHALTADAMPTPSGGSTRPMLPPYTPSKAKWRAEEDILPNVNVTLFEREFYLPLPADFIMPAITHFAFHEHKGHVREAWRHSGYISASIADRPCMIPPSDGCYHFIGQVYDFVQYIAAHGLRVYVNTSHVECGPAAWASWKLWPEKIRDGRMLQAAEELLWIICIGERSFAEQPHTAHEHIIGPPTFVANANEHGGKDKTWCVWSRLAGVLLPTNVVPPHERQSILASATGTRDERMLKRSGTEPEMAAAIVSAIDKHHGDGVEPRPANVPCSQYTAWRRGMHHNFGILSASYAPTLTAVEIMAHDAPCALLLPIAPSAKGALIMVPLRGNISFGIVLSETESYKVQAERASEFISIGIETHHLHRMRDARRHLVVAVPWDKTPVTHAATPAALAEAHASGAPAVWVHPQALQDSPLLEPALCAVQRLLAMGAAVTHDDLSVGVWNAAKPVVLRRKARQYGSLPANPSADKQWAAFLDEERRRAEVMQRDLRAADGGTGLTAGITADVRTAVDYASELPVPPQGLPTYDDPSLLLVSAPEAPLPLHTNWLHRLPPQQVPPGFTSIAYTDALRRWARRIIADTKNQNMRFDAYCLQHGEAPANASRARDVVLGRGAGKHFGFADGIGSFNVLDIMLETGADGVLYPFDFEKPDRRTWVFEAIKRHIGATTDQEMMSFFYHGVRWKLKAPKQIRVLHNIRRMDTRIAKVNKKLAELTSKGYISAHPICKVHDGLTEDGPNPFLYLPEWDCPLGGADKPGKPDVARVLGDLSAPRGVRERNEPDGEPSGPEADSFNDLSGPKGGVKPGFSGYVPFPDPETKPRPRHKYTATAYLLYYAHLAETFCVTLDDDQVDCFFQYDVAEEDLPLCRWNTVDIIDGVIWYIAYKVYTMNQGGRNASKVACRGNELWLDAWRRRMDAVVADWLPRQTAAMQAAYAKRLEVLGFAQARPFWAALYTDNFDITFCASELAAKGTFLWREMNGEAGIRMQPHVAYGTCTDWIGGRFLVTAGFGCLAPSKRERAIINVERSLAGELSRELFEKNNSFLVHVADICDWPVDSLKGIYGPLKRPGFDDDLVAMTPIATTRLRAVQDLLRERPLASFWSGVADALLDWPGVGSATKLIRVHAFDTCTDPVREYASLERAEKCAECTPFCEFSR